MSRTKGAEDSLEIAYARRQYRSVSPHGKSTVLDTRRLRVGLAARSMKIK